METGVEQTGVMDLFESAEAFETARGEAIAANANGRPNQVLAGDHVRRVVPGLRGQVAGGIVYTNEWFCDPLTLTTAVGRAAAERGVTFRTGVEATSITTANGRVVGVETRQGPIACGATILAAGVWSRGLAKRLGVKLPVESGKGYHIEFARLVDDPEMPFILHEAHVAVTPLPHALRFAGTLELSGLDESISRRRVAAILAVADRLFGESERSRVTQTWSGLRPCSPDGLPMLGPVRAYPNLFTATGHGMQGIVLGPGSGRALAQAIADEKTDVDLEPMRPDRF
jgi:D-amino-acid dehydrogenase